VREWERGKLLVVGDTCPLDAGQATIGISRFALGVATVGARAVAISTDLVIDAIPEAFRRMKQNISMLRETVTVMYCQPLPEPRKPSLSTMVNHCWVHGRAFTFVNLTDREHERYT